MKIIVVQPAYFAGEKPDEEISKFLLDECKKVAEDSLIVLPEYSNAGGLSDIEREKAALPRAKKMLVEASKIAMENKAYVAINVLEEREGKIKNSTYLYNKKGEVSFVYDKQHLPPSELLLGVEEGTKDGPCKCVCDVDGIRFAFMTCYDVYFNEQIEYIAHFKPDIIVVPGYQRGERTDIIRAQAKLLAFRCNAYVARSSYSMNDEEHGSCSMIVAPDGKIIADIGKGIGSISAEVLPLWKYFRSAGFGGEQIRNDDFIGNGLYPNVFKIN